MCICMYMYSYICIYIYGSVRFTSFLLFAQCPVWEKKYVLRGDRGHKKHEIAGVELFQHLWLLSGCASNVKYSIFEFVSAQYKFRKMSMVPGWLRGAKKAAFGHVRPSNFSFSFSLYISVYLYLYMYVYIKYI